MAPTCVKRGIEKKTLHRWAVYTPDDGGKREGGRGDVGLRGVRGTTEMNRL